MYRYYISVIFMTFLFSCQDTKKEKHPLVLMTDFGTKDGAVAAMKGVALQQSDDLQIHDLTHEIPAFNIWEGAYRLQQTAPFWLKGTVFVGVVDPGVGTERKPLVVKTKSGHFFVGPDNGLFTLVAEAEGVEEVREIAKANRLPGSDASYTFHGRDVFAYTGAKLAAGLLNFEDVGPEIPADQLFMITYFRPGLKNGVISGNIPILDVQYGNVWTNIDQKLFDQLKVKPGQKIMVRISHGTRLISELTLPYVHSFGDVKKGENLAYMNSLMNLSFGINMDDFAKTHGVSSGPEWLVEITAAENSLQK